MANDERDRSKLTTRKDNGSDALVPVAHAPREACIVVIYGPDLGRRAPLSHGAFEIGRSPRSDLPIDQESVSRHHARIVEESGTYIVSDLASTNGTFVNEKRVDDATLADGDQIKIGQSILKFISGENIEGSYHEEIHRLMTIDNLTDAYNPRYFRESLNREYLRATRYKRDVSLVAFDLDHFKRVNDAYGHVAGDHVLRQIARAVKAQIRVQDVLARVGGEEFCVLLPEIDLIGARATAEKIRRVVAGIVVPFGDARIQVTASLGVSALTAAMGDATALQQAADVALYLAKENGRNRVEG